MTQHAGRESWALHVVDLFVYVVVLNLTTQLVPSVLTESFAVSLLTAVLLKVVLELVVAVKTRLVARLRAARTATRRAVSAGMLLLVLPGSKLLVLEAVDVVFGDRVSLGGFVPVTGLIAVLMLARVGVRRILGVQAEGATVDTLAVPDLRGH
ncbi:hypothetical protein [Cellulomonas sp. HZM]|uniref:hypothetical protein n=1 Tax=Cellulomonas sp. HZM TaxID=1454010 RepID=UPI00068C1B1A|nr:hypothetical protein [Cellulomonas sp. HZM]